MSLFLPIFLYFSRYEKLLSIDKSVVESMWKFTKDTRQFLKYREAVADAIEELGKT